MSAFGNVQREHDVCVAEEQPAAHRLEVEETDLEEKGRAWLKVP